MDTEVRPTRLGQAILATLAQLDPPKGRSQNEAVRRARMEPSWLSKVIYGKVSIGYARLRRLAAANDVGEAEFRKWIDAKLEDQREAAHLGERLATAPLSVPRAPEVAPPVAPAGFRAKAGRGGGTPRAARREAADDAATLSGAQADRDVAARILARVMAQLEPLVRKAIDAELAGMGKRKSVQYAEGRAGSR